MRELVIELSPDARMGGVNSPAVPPASLHLILGEEELLVEQLSKNPSPTRAPIQTQLPDFIRILSP